MSAWWRLKSNGSEPRSLLKQLHARLFRAVAALLFLAVEARTERAQSSPGWTSPNHFRVLLGVEHGGRKRSNSPASIDLDFQEMLNARGRSGTFDENTIEVVPLKGAVIPRPRNGPIAPRRLPHRIDKFFGLTTVTLDFVVPDETQTDFAVYFDTIESRLGNPERYHGLVGDGDRFCGHFQRREIAASHFDCFLDFDADGDLDLFKGGVEPFVYCYENRGGNRFVERGRLTSGGKLFTLPCSKSNRSWATVAFFDIDADGDQDFFPSFGDGPDAGRIIFYRNTTHETGGQLTFTRIGPLQTESATPLAAGAQAGGWFPSITFVQDWNADGVGPDALVGSNHHCWLYRNIGMNADGAPRFADAVAVQAGGQDIVLVNPRFDCADIDDDGDLDLFAGTQPGSVYWFKNIGAHTIPEFAVGKVIAWDGKHLIGDAHSGVKVADFDGDGLLDIVSGRFWERTDLNAPAARRDFGRFDKNLGTRTSPRFARQMRGAPFTEQFQICDAVRQNSVRTVDWNEDGKRDLLAGDTDGFIWFFRNAGDHWFPFFATGEKLRAAGQPLAVATSGGHARLDVYDWNNDGRNDLLVADGQGTVTLFLNKGRKAKPVLAAGQKISADAQPIHTAARASLLMCDWDNDGRNDLVLADEKGYYFSRNLGTAAAPLLAQPRPILFGGKRASYVRPNLGSFVDWDGDRKRDLIGCHFENSVRFYRNVGSGAPNAEPEFAHSEGVVILEGKSPQMISGADAVDWNGDGDLDIVTGQGHGGSGLRFYERDWIENELHGTHPVVTVIRSEMRSRR